MVAKFFEGVGIFGIFVFLLLFFGTKNQDNSAQELKKDSSSISKDLKIISLQLSLDSLKESYQKNSEQLEDIIEDVKTLDFGSKKIKIKTKVVQIYRGLSDKLIPSSDIGEFTVTGEKTSQASKDVAISKEGGFSSSEIQNGFSGIKTKKVDSREARKK